MLPRVMPIGEPAGRLGRLCASASTVHTAASRT
jgi:hypothetical protein